MGDSVKLPLHIPNIRDHTSPLRRKQKYSDPMRGMSRGSTRTAAIQPSMRQGYAILAGSISTPMAKLSLLMLTQSSTWALLGTDLPNKAHYQR